VTANRIIIFVLIFIFAVFVAQNAVTVEVRLLFWSVEASRAIVLLITFVLGMAAGALLALRPRRAVDRASADLPANKK